MLSAVSKRSSALTKTAAVFLLCALGFLLAPASSLGSQPDHPASRLTTRVKRGVNIASLAQVGPAVSHFPRAALPAKLQNIRRSNWRITRQIAAAAPIGSSHHAAEAQTILSKMSSRRTFLRGAGVALGLPWLEAFATQVTAQVQPAPARMAMLYMPNGVNTRTPQGQGRAASKGVGGRAGGRSSQHLVCGDDSPLANLYVSMLDAFGTPVERFADNWSARRAGRRGLPLFAKSRSAERQALRQLQEPSTVEGKVRRLFAGSGRAGPATAARSS